MTEAVIGVARSHAIPYQTEVMSGKTGTDADNVTCARDGVPCAPFVNTAAVYAFGGRDSLAFRYGKYSAPDTGLCRIQRRKPH